MNCLGELVMKQAITDTLAHRLDSTIMAHIKILDSFGVVGIEKQIEFNDVVGFLVNKGVRYDLNHRKKLIWIPSAISEVLCKQFLHNYSS